MADSDANREAAAEAKQDRVVQRAAGGFMWVEHSAYIALGVLLSLAAVLGLASSSWVLVSGLADWTGTRTILLVIDRLLFVLMVVEILHTVRASMNTGSLSTEPFLVVGLIATIRRVLVITLESSETTKQDTMTDAAQRMFQSSMMELGVLAVLILVMVVSLRLLKPLGRHDV